MKKQDELIRLLNQPGAQSGTKLGEVLGMSRVAVQKRIQALIENGLPIEAVPGKGYTLANGVHLLDQQEIQSALKPNVHLKSIDVLQSVESTNSHLLAQSLELGQARVCVAEMQSSGRGRRGNSWRSSPYRNIMLSMSWGFNHWPETITGLGLAVALVVVEHLNERFDLEVEIKWPNDLMVGGDKLAGVLIDVSGESSGSCNVVIGLGLNVYQPDWSKELGGDYLWQDLYGLGVSLNRNELIADIVSKWSAMLTDFSQYGFGPLASRWNELSCYAGKPVRVGSGDGVVVGEMVGVDSAGALLLKGFDGIGHRFSDSTVSVRLMK